MAKLSPVFEIVSSRLKIYEGAVLVGMLRSHGLAAQMWYQHTAGLEGELTYGGVSVMVPSEERDDAFQLIATNVELADEWVADESVAPEVYAAKYPDLLSLLLFFVKWAVVAGFLICFAPPILTVIADMRRGVVDTAEIIPVLGHSLQLLAGAAALGAIIAVLGAIAFYLFRQMDRSRNIRTVTAALCLVLFYPLVSIAALVDLVLTGWGDD